MGRKKVTRIQLRALELMRTTSIDWILEDTKPDFLIRLEEHPKSSEIRQDDFVKVEEIIQMGRELGERFVQQNFPAK